MNKWVTEGVTVFKWTSWFKHVLRPHRFAMIPPTGLKIDWSVFRPDKYYLHVYQTKIERGRNDLRTLHSRSIAKSLNENWRSQYWPRSIDLDTAGVHRNRTYTQYPRARQQLTSDSYTRRTNTTSRHTSSFRQRKKNLRRSRLIAHHPEDIKNSDKLKHESWKQNKQYSTRYWRQNSTRTRRNSWASSKPDSLRTGSHRNERTRRRTRTAEWSDNDQSKNSTKARSNLSTVESRYNSYEDLTRVIQQISKDVSILKRRLDSK